MPRVTISLSKSGSITFLSASKTCSFVIIKGVFECKVTHLTIRNFIFYDFYGVPLPYGQGRADPLQVLASLWAFRLHPSRETVMLNLFQHRIPHAL
jgi:hypothetical protein